jgi:two-component sensor histidine kinase
MRRSPTVSHDSSLVADLNHRINSPLASIRNAIYLAACRTADPQMRRYLRLADDEVAAIAAILRVARLETVARRVGLTRAAVARSPRAIV